MMFPVVPCAALMPNVRQPAFPGVCMKQYYYGAKRHGPYFEGWYFKLLTRDGEALALIPALHIDRKGRRSASLQVISREASWWLEYADTEFHAWEDRLQIQMGPSLFSEKGVSLRIAREGLSLCGAIRCGPFLPLSSDIMGPFRFVPGMECSHGVISMAHPLDGQLVLNGRTMNFSGGTGYIETDRGRSFPDRYLWTQCAWQEARRSSNSIMLSVATIPLPVGRFTGCICAVVCHGREYRLATYRGARVQRWASDGAVIRQGNDRLTVELLEGRERPLRAPVEGSMGRTIHESLCAGVRYRFWHGGALLLSHTDCQASFEYAD